MPIEIKQSDKKAPVFCKLQDIRQGQIYQVACAKSGHEKWVGQICIGCEINGGEEVNTLLYFPNNPLSCVNVLSTQYLVRCGIELIHLPDKVVTISY